jgi:hypothetical protein
MASKMIRSRGRALNRWAKAALTVAYLTGAANHSGGVVATARWQGHVKATGEALLVLVPRNRTEQGSRITGNARKSVEDERVSDELIVAMMRGNARGAKKPCCMQTTPTTWKARV